MAKNVWIRSAKENDKVLKQEACEGGYLEWHEKRALHRQRFDCKLPLLRTNSSVDIPTIQHKNLLSVSIYQ